MTQSGNASRACVTASLDALSSELDTCQSDLIQRELASEERFALAVAELFADRSIPAGRAVRRFQEAFLDRMEDQGAGDLQYVLDLLERKLAGLEHSSTAHLYLRTAQAAVESAREAMRQAFA
ncbi:Uncharacterised protein [Mycobacteroides abscessus subsp. abscessus]|nr:Uncharacterised protein [Mycobacteroides abscessus subsp. abscessus]SHW32833.1 Uncharacterised protein [Mycobacteroides abscessus subsp. abscessus]SHW39475.1 Uncharacterised protein [Mycobacteroides abscessus subsp. abscessus]SHW67565.1 Uncharacterised protein [Mycobacteroides abscessus subsp. abscessus]SHX16900.1 Uncharacterised protein [Mycobacteroides abscessus subsp. abscessus]